MTIIYPSITEYNPKKSKTEFQNETDCVLWKAALEITNDHFRKRGNTLGKASVLMFWISVSELWQCRPLYLLYVS